MKKYQQGSKEVEIQGNPSCNQSMVSHLFLTKTVDVVSCGAVWLL